MKHNLNIDQIVRQSSPYQSTEVLRLHAGERDWKYSPKLWNTFISRLGEQDIRLYPNIDRAIQKLSSFLNVATDRLTIAEGSDRILKNIFECFAVSGTQVLSVSPAFPMYKIYSQLYNTEYIDIPYDIPKFPYDTFCSKITPSVNLVIISNPCSPIGDQLTFDQLIEIHNLCKINDCLLVVDEAYIDFANGDSADTLVNQGNIIIVRTFSKAQGSAGIRLGYSISNEYIANILNSVSAMNALSTPAIVWMETLIDNYTEVVDYVERVKFHRQLLEEFLALRNIVYIPSNTNSINMLKDISLPNIIVKTANLFDDTLWTRVCIPGDTDNMKMLMTTL